ERHTGLDVDDTAAVKVEFDQDVGLFGGALHPRASAHARPSLFVASSKACRKAAISAAVPMLTRSQSLGPVSRINTPRSSSACQIACRSSNRPKNTKLASESATVNG